MNLSDEILLLRKLSELNRQIVSIWRANLIYQKYKDPFTDDKKTKKYLRNLQKNGLISPLDNYGSALWQVTSPYVDKSQNIYEVVGEAYSIGSFCYSTSFELLKLTDQRSKIIHVCLPDISISNLFEVDENLMNELLPPDTEFNDWQIREVPGRINITDIWEHSIQVHNIRSEWFFGADTATVNGVSVKSFTLERALVDGLRMPKYCSGLNEVFRVWVRALDLINIERLIQCVEKYDITIMYQRVGFVAETLGLRHPKFKVWKKEKTPRGGSRVLNPDKEYESNYDEEWNISINHPTSILENKDEAYS